MQRAEAWRDYVAGQRNIAWNTTLEQTGKLERMIDHVVALGDSLSSRYPVLARFFSARKTLAARGIATKKMKKKDAAPASKPVT